LVSRPSEESPSTVTTARTVTLDSIDRPLVCPIFILSLPRAGSTLLQRAIAAHPEVSTTGETWLLLPHIYLLRRRGVFAEYCHALTQSAIHDFARQLPGGLPEYESYLRQWILTLYTKASVPGTTHFVDKTPRYSLIAEELIDLFPSAKFIVLWRNPLAVLSSLSRSLYHGKWAFHPQKAQLMEGLPNMIDISRRLPHRICTVQFETLVTSPECELRRVFNYLELDFDPSVIERFADVQLDGPADPTGVTEYQRFSQEPLEKWKVDLVNPIRKAWSKSYLAFLGKDNLSHMGYDIEELVDGLDGLPNRYDGLLNDAYQCLYAIAYSGFQGPVFKYLWRRRHCWKRIYGHS